jgi:hypothetical protein
MSAAAEQVRMMLGQQARMLLLRDAACRLTHAASRTGDYIRRLADDGREPSPALRRTFFAQERAAEMAVLEYMAALPPDGAGGEQA